MMWNLGFDNRFTEKGWERVGKVLSCPPGLNALQLHCKEIDQQRFALEAYVDSRKPQSDHDPLRKVFWEGRSDIWTITRNASSATLRCMKNPKLTPQVLAWRWDPTHPRSADRSWQDCLWQKTKFSWREQKSIPITVKKANLQALPFALPPKPCEEQNQSTWEAELLVVKWAHEATLTWP